MNKATKTSSVKGFLIFLIDSRVDGLDENTLHAMLALLAKSDIKISRENGQEGTKIQIEEGSVYGGLRTADAQKAADDCGANVDPRLSAHPRF